MYPAKRINRYFLVVFLYFIAASYLLSPLLYALFPSVSGSSIILQFFIYLPLLFFFFYRFPISVKSCLSLRPLGFQNALISMGIAFFSMPFVSILVLLTSYLQPNLAEASMESMRNSNFFAVLFLIAIQPAVFEELLFRGVALQAYGHMGEKKAILISAFFFALLHMNLQQALYAFLLGVIFAFLVQRTGSIFASVLPHFFINASNWVALYFTEPQLGVAEEYTFGQQLLSVGIQCLFALPFLIGLIYLFLRKNPKSAYPQPMLLCEDAGKTEKTERFFTPSVFLIIAIFLLVGVLPTLSLGGAS